jgi:hypothetical protein
MVPIPKDSEGGAGNCIADKLTACFEESRRTVQTSRTQPNFKLSIQQQKCFLEKGQLQRKPRQALLDDLSWLIHEWKDAGEHNIVLTTDGC